MFDQLFFNVHLATMDPTAPAPYGAVADGALAVKNGRIAWVGAERDLPGSPETLAGEATDLGGRWMTPGLIDCHTHLVFGGDRAGEFEMRLNGASYEEISRAGGGILSTVKATRAASENDLVNAALIRLDALIAGGVTTVEIKSGYGLDLENEFKMLRAAARLGDARAVRIRRTFLALHALPAEYNDRREAYVSKVCDEMMPAIADEGAADAVDAFCEGIGFTADEVEAAFRAAHAHGLAVKLHAEQLSNLGGAALAAKYNALSADHLEYLDEDGVRAMAEAGMVAVLLPGAFYALREEQRPPIDLLREYKVPMAVATDMNPGTSPVVSPTLMLNMASTLFGLTPEESLAGMTVHAARALGLQDETGVLKTGSAADLAIWEIDQPAELTYWIGLRGPTQLFAGGREITAT